MDPRIATTFDKAFKLFGRLLIADLVIVELVYEGFNLAQVLHKT